MTNMNRFILENLALRTIGGVMPPYWLFNHSAVSQVDESQFDQIRQMSDEELKETIVSNALGIPMSMPLQMKLVTSADSAEFWTLPLEPLVSISGKNIIIKRYVNKSAVRGSIKERWTQDDYSINIQGALINLNNPDAYPDADVRELRSFCEASSVYVASPLLEIFGITRMVIEDYEFPHTSGISNQNYIIRAVSDDMEQIFLRDDVLKVK